METKIWELYLGRPGKIDKWMEYGAGGRRVCPRVPDGFPIWKNLPLSQKLPYVRAPSHICLSRGLPAESLLSRKRAHDFRLFDAYCRELHTPYESIHDKHLKNHFGKKTVASCSRHVGHMNVEKNAAATLQNLNKFREMSRLMNLDHVHFSMNSENEAKTDKNYLNRIEENLKQTQYNWDTAKALNNLRQQHREEIAEITAAKMKRWQTKLLKNEQQAAHLRKSILEKQRKLKDKNTLKTEKIQKNLKSVSMCKRQKLLGLKRKIRENDHEFWKRKREKSAFRAAKKREIVKQKWEAKCEEMLKMEAKAQEIRTNMMKTHNANVEIRKQRAAQIKEYQDELRFFRQLMRKYRHAEQIKLNKKQPIKTDSTSSIVADIIDFIIDSAITEWVEQKISPELSIATRIASEYGCYALNMLRMGRSRPSKERIKNSMEDIFSQSSKRSEDYPTQFINPREFYDQGLKSVLKPSIKMTENVFVEKEKLEEACRVSIPRLFTYAKMIISECVEPKTRALTIIKLKKYEQRQEHLSKILAIGVVNEDPTMEAIVAAGIARAAITNIFNPQEWRKPESKIIQIRRVAHTK